MTDQTLPIPTDPQERIAWLETALAETTGMLRSLVTMTVSEGYKLQDLQRLRWRVAVNVKELNNDCWYNPNTTATIVHPGWVIANVSNVILTDSEMSGIVSQLASEAQRILDQMLPNMPEVGEEGEPDDEQA